jgi:hypothetical protein
MIPNAAFLAAVLTFLAVAWVAGELSFLAPWKGLLFRRHGWLIGGAALMLFLNLTALFYTVSRWLFLRDTGRKLLHLDRQLGTSDGMIDDITGQLDA